MNSLKTAVLSLALASNMSLAGDCEMPEIPEMPDGATASMEQMLAGQKAVKAFQALNLDYMACLEKAFTKAEAAIESAPEMGKEAAEAAYQKALDAYNAAVSQEETVAGGFNTAIKAYKAANPS